MLMFLFVFSFVAIAILVAVKMYENNKNSQTPLLRALSKLDLPLGRRIETERRRYERRKQEAIEFTTRELPRRAILTALAAKDAVKEKYATMLPDIRGSRILKKGGKVSEFLKDISKYKEENGKGRIDDPEINNLPPTN